MPNESSFIKGLFPQPLKDEEAAPYESALVKARKGEIPYLTNANQIRADQRYLIDPKQSLTGAAEEPGIIMFDDKSKPLPEPEDLPDITMAPGLKSGPPSEIHLAYSYHVKKAEKFPDNDYIKIGDWHKTSSDGRGHFSSDMPFYPYPPPAGGRRRKTRRRTIKKRRRTRSKRPSTA
jgi:hypothetical protein